MVDIKFEGKLNDWQLFTTKFREQHPELSYQQAMTQASPFYQDAKNKDRLARGLPALPDPKKRVKVGKDKDPIVTKVAPPVVPPQVDQTKELKNKIKAHNEELYYDLKKNKII